MSRFYDWVTRGTRSGQAAAASSNKGMLYWVKDEGKLERSSGSAWEQMSSNADPLLASATANNTATHLDILTRNAGDFTGDLFQADFDVYRIELVSLVPATNAVGFGFRVSTDGATFVSTGTYSDSGMAYGPGGPGNNARSSVSEIRTVTFVNVSNNSVYSLNGTFRTWSPLSTALKKIFGGHTHFVDNSPGLVINTVSGLYDATTAIKGIQLITTSGNIVSGAMYVFGVRKT